MWDKNVPTGSCIYLGSKCTRILGIVTLLILQDKAWSIEEKLPYVVPVIAALFQLGTPENTLRKVQCFATQLPSPLFWQIRAFTPLGRGGVARVSLWFSAAGLKNAANFQWFCRFFFYVSSWEVYVTK